MSAEQHSSTDLLDSAFHFVNTTSSHIFLTGKAGTGKTTFLKNLAATTHKSYAIVAPTGIAALNSGGVTIHSQFQLPLGTFIPDRTPSGDFNSESSVYTQYTLTRKHPISSLRKQVLRSIDLLIIDEVSMLRADVLDAIDYRLRSVRGNFHQSFGGVQVLMIGDLYQLPPIVKDHEWNYLKRYYHSAHFFEAKALQTDGFVFIELEKIFRQSDHVFIDLLNNLRNNIATAEDITLLNSHFKTPDVIKDEKEIVTITTHNYRADELNRKALDNLEGRSFFYNAAINDEFPENIYPLPEKLELKSGAQVMFVKNDASGEGKYFNGKLATVVRLDEDEIVVEMSGSHERLLLERLTWENKKYTVNATSRELDDEVVGTFMHFPIKLAWAITVHKSQGLTFEKAIIDVGQAFAAGQVYVALSRLKSLDGLVLRTRIEQSAISNDARVVEFSGRKDLQENLEVLLDKKQHAYLHHILKSTFDFGSLVKEIRHHLKENAAADFEEETMKPVLVAIADAFAAEEENTAKFRYQLLHLLEIKDHNALLERMAKGAAYYKTSLKENTQKLLTHIEEVKRQPKQKTYLSHLAEIDQLITKKWDEVEKAATLTQSILVKGEIPKELLSSAERQQQRSELLDDIREKIGVAPVLTKPRKTRGEKKPKGPKVAKGDSVLKSLELLRSGKTIAEIATERGLVVGTIESHFASAIGLGKMEISEFLQGEELDELTNAVRDNKEESMNPVYAHFNGKYSFGKIRAVQAHLLVTEKKGR